MEKPILCLKEIPTKPTLFPAKKKAIYPKKPIADPWKDSLLKLKGQKTPIDKWEMECVAIDSEIQREWNKLRDSILHEYELTASKIKSENQKLTDEYDKKSSEWEKSLEKECCRYRYFKLQAFTDSGIWFSQNFDSKVICVWYIAYILLLIKERFGDDVSIQFGVPVGASGLGEDQMITDRAYSLYIAAYNLANNYNTIDDYLKASYNELLEHTIIDRVNDEIKNQYIFDDIPEAFAGLISVTTQKRLGSGFHMLVDIGGGTTDIAMFYVNNKTLLPDVIAISSFSIGLNYIFENTSNGKQLTEDLQKEFLNNSKSEKFREVVFKYKKILADEGRKVENRLIESFDASQEHHGKKRSDLERALENHPIVYCGGGSVYDIIQSAIGFFTEIRKVNKEMLNISNVRNAKKIAKELYAILAISYGLASFEKPFDEGIKCTDISVVFQKCLPKAEKKESTLDYGIIDD